MSAFLDMLSNTVLYQTTDTDEKVIGNAVIHTEA